MKRIFFGTPLMGFCEVCGHSLSDGHSCFKEKFKIYKPVDKDKIYTIIDYSKITLNHTIVNQYGSMMRVNLHDQIEFVNGHELIGKEVVRKVKKSLSKKSKG